MQRSSSSTMCATSASMLPSVCFARSASTDIAVAKIRWITVSWRSLAIRSRSSRSAASSSARRNDAPVSVSARPRAVRTASGDTCVRGFIRTPFFRRRTNPYRNVPAQPGLKQPHMGPAAPHWGPHIEGTAECGGWRVWRYPAASSRPRSAGHGQQLQLVVDAEFAVQVLDVAPSRVHRDAEAQGGALQVDAAHEERQDVLLTSRQEGGAATSLAGSHLLGRLTE